MYGAEVVTVTTWFVLLALFLSTGRMRRVHQSGPLGVDGGVGLIFGGVGCSILIQEARRAVDISKRSSCIVSLDMCSFNFAALRICFYLFAEIKASFSWNAS